MLSEHVPAGYDVILMAETIYNPSSMPVLIECLLATLKHSPDAFMYLDSVQLPWFCLT
jgi:hypothetical protein